MDNERNIRCIISNESENQRLDIFLASRFTYRSRSAWQESVRMGKILLNDQQVRPSRVLHENDIIAFIPDEQELIEPEIDPSFSILLETPDFLAVNKSGNLPVHPSGRYFCNTLLMLMKPQYGELYPVNRLDRETSGVILFAKTPEAAKRLSVLFETGRIRKTYLAIVYGTFPKQLSAKGFLGPDKRSSVAKKRWFYKEEPENMETLQTAETDFLCLASNGKFSVVKCLPKTGRLHQLRATLCSLGFPLAGDKLYGPDDTIFLRQINDSLTERDHLRLVLPRQALHAWELVFCSPFTGENLTIRAPNPFAEMPEVSDLFTGIDGSQRCSS